MNTRKWIVVLVLAAFAMLPVTGWADNGSPVPVVDASPLFAISLEPSVVPNPMEHIIFHRLVYEPGADFTVSGSEEWVRGSAQLVEIGSLTITPIVDALVWRGDAVVGGDPETVLAGLPVDLATGDLIYLPPVPQAEADRLGDYHFANTGDGETTTIGFHLHEPDSAAFLGLPSGLTSFPSLSMGTLQSLQPLAEAGGVAQLRLVTLQPGESLPVANKSVVTGYELVEGSVRYEMTKSGNATPSTEIRWREGTMNSAAPFEGVDLVVINPGDDTIQLLELTFIPAEG